MRRIDPTRPICFDSNYQAKNKDKKYGADFMNSIDDGDIDDMHGYYNWYDFSLFRFFNGEFQKQFKMAIVHSSAKKCLLAIPTTRQDILPVLTNSSIRILIP